MRKLLLGLGLAALTATSGVAQTVEWSFNNTYAPTRDESRFIREMAADLAQRSNNRFTLRVFEGGAMNLRDADALRWMQQGTPQMGFIWPPFLGRDAPDIAALYVYGSVSDAAEHLRAVPALKEILAEAMRARNIEPVGFMGLSLLEASLFCRQPVRTLAELQRLKLRVGTREQVDTFRALNVAAQIIPQNELYAAVQTGVVDCALYPARIAHTISLQEVAKHVVGTGFPFPPTPYVFMANRGAWAALSAENRAFLTAATAETERRSFDFSGDAAAEAQARQRLEQAGVTFHGTLPQADRDQIRTAALRTWETVARETGATAIDYRNRILRALGRGTN